MDIFSSLHSDGFPYHAAAVPPVSGQVEQMHTVTEPMLLSYSLEYCTVSTLLVITVVNPAGCTLMYTHVTYGMQLCKSHIQGYVAFRLVDLASCHLVTHRRDWDRECLHYAVQQLSLRCVSTPCMGQVCLLTTMQCQSPCDRDTCVT